MNKQDLKGVLEHLRGREEEIPKRQQHNGTKAEKGKAEWERK